MLTVILCCILLSIFINIRDFYFKNENQLIKSIYKKMIEDNTTPIEYQILNYDASALMHHHILF
jgi:hypothetical protein